VGVTARSDGVGKGSEFTARIPITTRKPTVVDIPSEEPPAEHCRVVIVEVIAWKKVSGTFCAKHRASTHSGGHSGQGFQTRFLAVAA
jgi:hypothetical protein